MGKECCAPSHDKTNSPKYRRVLWLALAINAIMFAVEIVSGILAGSVSLQADAIDFLGDAANYGISLFVLSMVLKVRAKAAYLKGISMYAFGLWVLVSTIWHFFIGTLPESATMGAVGFAALLANATVLALLWAYRTGDSNMRSVWLCSRNDVIGNFAVLMAALGVFGTQSGWPDLAVAFLMSLLAIQSGYLVMRDAKAELRK